MTRRQVRLTSLLGSAVALAALGIDSSKAMAASYGPSVAPGIATLGQNTTPEDASTSLNLTVWLNIHNRAALDRRVSALYDPSSPTYHHWLTGTDLKPFMPTDAEVATVRQELQSYGITVTSTSPYNLGLRITGSTAEVQAAFHTGISRTTVNGRLLHVTASTPAMAGAAAASFAGLGGVDGAKPTPLIMFPFGQASGRRVGANTFAAARTLAASAPTPGPCFSAPVTVTVSGGSTSAETMPASTSISGLVYGDPAGVSSGGACGYAPADVQQFYGMQAAYAAGYDGSGQTIVIVDAYQEPQAEADANVFNGLYGLPALTAANFAAYAPDGSGLIGGNVSVEYVEETDLDVEWAHALAPGAKIALLQAYSDDEEDIQDSLLYAVSNHLGNVISLSYGSPEQLTSPLALDIFNSIAEVAAASGISLQVSSGDSGDYTSAGIPADVNGWGSSPYDTVVGGTSIASNTDGSLITVGWGNNLNELGGDYGDGLTLVEDPPSPGDGVFEGGAGGGSSRFFAKPAYQASLPGNQRLMPDVSALADPYTGAEFVYSYGGSDVIGPVGGTSLAAPIISGMWAIFNQFSGTPAGQAAPFIAAAPPSVIRDVVPFSGPANVTESVTDSSGTTAYDAAQLSSPLFTTTEFVSAIYNGDPVGMPPLYLNITFGTDSSLQTAVGWDDVTGYGTPDMSAAVSLFGTVATK